MVQSGADMPADAAEATAGRVDALLAELRRGPDPRAAAVAEELTRCLVQLYGEGLRRTVAGIGPELTATLCADPLLESLLLVHDLHPLDADSRIRQVVERAWPGPGELSYQGIDDAGVARLRLTTSGSGCGSSRAAVRAEAEALVRRAAPELAGVEVQMPPPPAPLLQITVRPGSAPRPVAADTGR